MSIEVLKAGIADTIQDFGRYGHQHLGINPSGVMDINGMSIANALIGNPLNEAVIELRFPASTLYFNQPTLIAMSGGDFSAKLNGRSIPINHPVYVSGKSELKFTRLAEGNFLYLAIHGGVQSDSWLNSKSTNNKAFLGGINGRALRKNDKIILNKKIQQRDSVVFPWYANTNDLYSSTECIRCIKGNEFDWLKVKSQKDLLSGTFKIKSTSDRMGYQLDGVSLKRSSNTEMLSTAVTSGTVQLLPSGNLIVLMADHQTTGGYPRVAHVLQADLPKLVQYKLNKNFKFDFVQLSEAEILLVNRQRLIKQLEFSCNLKFKENIMPLLA